MEITPNGSRQTSTLSRFPFLIAVAGATWFGREYPTPDGVETLWYSLPRIAGVPAHYVFLAIGLLVSGLFMIHRRPFPVAASLRRGRLLGWAALCTVAIAVAFSRAILANAPEPFADWRNFVVMAVVVVLSARFLSGQQWVSDFLLDLAIAYGLLAFIPLLDWALGGGAWVFDQRVPLYDGTHLTIQAYAAVVTIGVWFSGTVRRPRYRAALVHTAAITSSLVLLLSFRRGFWLFWVIGIVALTILKYWKPKRTRGLSTGQRRGISALLLGVVVASLAVTLIGPERVAERIASINPNTTNRFSATTDDHFNDILDALDVIKEQPLAGFGIGTEYATRRISVWKTSSFEVHNAVIHVWLKFGLLGLIAYLGFHARWIIQLFRSDHPNPVARTTLTTSAVFLVAEILAGMAWTMPYGRIHIALHHAILLAVFLVLQEEEVQYKAQSEELVHTGISTMASASPAA